MARAVLNSLARQLVRQFRQIDPATIEQAVIDAVWEYLKHPQACLGDTSEAVASYLRGAARNKVLSELRRDRRRRAREELWGSQAAAEVDTNSVELSDAATTLEREEDATALKTRKAELMQALNSDTDRRLLELRLDGERKTVVFAEALGIAHLPIAEQRRIVKQNKDRIDKIVRRARENT
jgi:DNA-directed RNA polymerase specialized sigma24 family protein